MNKNYQNKACKMCHEEHKYLKTSVPLSSLYHIKINFSSFLFFFCLRLKFSPQKRNQICRQQKEMQSNEREFDKAQVKCKRRFNKKKFVSFWFNTKMAKEANILQARKSTF